MKSKNTKIKVDTRKVGNFLKTISDVDYRYMQHSMGMRDSIQNLIKRHKLSKSEFCQRFEIKPTQYQNFITGNYNYSIKDMSFLNAAFIQLESEKLEEEVPFKVSKEPVGKLHQKLKK